MSFANGLANGVNMGIRLSQAKDYEDRQKVLRERDELAYNREEAQRAALEQANAAARKAFEEHRSAFEAASQPKAEERVTLMTKGDTQPSLGTASLGDGAPMPDVQLGGQQRPAGLAGSLSLGGGGGTPIPREQVQVQPAVRYDEREGVLAGLSARRKALMSANVDSKLWMDDWAKESALRSQMRGERIDAAERRFMSTGDPGEYAKAIYPLIDDGMEFVGTEPVKTQDGSQAWKFIRRDSQTGKEISSVMNAEQFQKFMLGVRDPAKVAEYESKSLLERMKADERIRSERAAEEAKQGTKAIEHKLALREISARGTEERRTVGARGAEDRRTEASKVIKLGEGDTAYGQEETPEGRRLVPVARGAGKNSARYSARELNQMVIENYGVSDMGGKAVGSDMTAKVSAAAELLLKANPQMGANEAIVRAAKDLNVNLSPKN